MTRPCSTAFGRTSARRLARRSERVWRTPRPRRCQRTARWFASSCSVSGSLGIVGVADDVAVFE
jgi:hypothetical protein